jgi:hypothetical protein
VNGIEDKFFRILPIKGSIVTERIVPSFVYEQLSYNGSAER